MAGGKLLEGPQEESRGRYCPTFSWRGGGGRGWGLTILCRLLDASLILRGIWTQPHQVKPGKQRHWQLQEDPGQPPTTP